MNDNLANPTDWNKKTLGEISILITDGAHFSPIPQTHGELIANVKDMKSNHIDFDSCTRIFPKDFESLFRQNCSPRKNDILLSKDGTIGKVILFNDERKIVVLSSIAIIRLVTEVSCDYVKHVLRSFLFDKQLYALQSGSALGRIVLSDIRKLEVPLPPLLHQRKIAKILTTVDNLIEQTQALIDKYTAIKQGMMADLFTRGIDLSGTPETNPNHGQLRPSFEEAPELYKETELGWVPKEWKVVTMSSVLESICDGPFGSNLKTEHYVEDAGVRVVRLQNIAKYRYNDLDKAFISEEHSNFLSRNKVLPGDVLIAGLGDDSYPVGRACCYPENLAPAVNKADCFRARCNSTSMINFFLMLFLNTELARKQIRRFEQGVTRPRINTGNFKKLAICCPSIAEQKSIIQKLAVTQNFLEIEESLLRKLDFQKKGLMQDLLTGKVQVTA